MYKYKYMGVVLCTVILTVYVCISCGKTVNSVTDQNRGIKKEIVWKVCHEEYAEIWQKPLNKLLKEKGVSYTVKIQPYYDLIEEQEETAAQRLRNMKQSNEQADVITVFPTEILDFEGNYIYTYRVVSKEGLLLSLDDYLNKAEGKRILEMIPANDLERMKINGKTYGLSVVMPSVVAVGYNKKYLEKYEISVEDLSDDIFENADILEDIRLREEGNVIPYMADSQGVERLCMNRIFPSEVLSYKKGEFVNVFETDEIKEYFYQMNELKEKDLVQFIDKNDGSEFFSISYPVSNDEIIETTYVSFDGAGQEISTDIIVVPNISQPIMGASLGDMATGVSSWTKNETEALDFLSLLYTDADLGNLISYGVEEQDYILKDGHVVYKNENNLRFFGDWFTNPLIAYPKKDMAYNPKTFLDAYYNQIKEEMPEDFRLNTDMIKKELAATNYVVYDENGEYTTEAGELFYLQTDNIDAVIGEINARLKSAGIDTIIEEAENQLAEWKKGN